MYPAFDAEVLHYAVGCHLEVTLSLSAENSDARVSVDGIQQPASNAEVTVSGLHNGDNGDAKNHTGPDATDIEIVVSSADGSSTTYVVHCIHDDYPEITPIRNPASDGIIEDLILMHLRPGSSRPSSTRTACRAFTATRPPPGRSSGCFRSTATTGTRGHSETVLAGGGLSWTSTSPCSMIRSIHRRRWWRPTATTSGLSTTGTIC